VTQIDYDTAFGAISAAVDEINLSQPEGAKVSKDPDAVLFGEGSAVDSVGLVQVVMAAEAHLAEQTGIDVVLASEAAMSRKRSPYRSLRLLAEYAVEVGTEGEPA